MQITIYLLENPWLAVALHSLAIAAALYALAWAVGLVYIRRLLSRAGDPAVVARYGDVIAKYGATPLKCRRRAAVGGLVAAISLIFAMTIARAILRENAAPIPGYLDELPGFDQKTFILMVAIFAMLSSAVDLARHGGETWQDWRRLLSRSSFRKAASGIYMLLLGASAYAILVDMPGRQKMLADQNVSALRTAVIRLIGQTTGDPAAIAIQYGQLLDKAPVDTGIFRAGELRYWTDQVGLLARKRDAARAPGALP